MAYFDHEAGVPYVKFPDSTERLRIDGNDAMGHPRLTLINSDGTGRVLTLDEIRTGVTKPLTINEDQAQESTLITPPDNNLPTTDPTLDAILEAFNNPNALPAGDVIILADNSSGTQTDAGNSTGYGNDSGNSTNITPHDPDSITTQPVFTAPTALDISTLNAAQNASLNDQLAVAGLNTGGDNNITALPPVNGMVILVNDDGVVVATVDTSQAGTDGTASISINGQAPVVVDRLGNSFDAQTAREMNQAAGGLNLFTSLYHGINNWGDASDLSRTQTVVNIYNQFNGLSGMPMTSLGGVGSVLNFAAAVENGDVGGIAYSGLQMVETLTSNGAGTLGIIGSINPNIIPGLGMILAIANVEENPLGVVCAALNFFPPVGPVIGMVLSILQVMLTREPISEGEAHASFDASGNLIVTTDSEQNGGGGSANHWMTQLANAAQLAGLQTPQAGAYTVGMPSVGYRYDPNVGSNANAQGEVVNGYLTLRWVDENGVAHSRAYLADGTAGFGDGQDLAEDFFMLMQTAQTRYPALAYQEVEGGIVQFDYGVATVVYATQTDAFNGMAEHTHGGEEDSDGAEGALQIEAGDLRLLQDDSNTIENSSQQTHVTLAASSLSTVVNPVIAPIQTKADVIGLDWARLQSSNDTIYRMLA